MEKRKKDFESPDITVTQVEIESAICNGSVEFKQEEQAATIEAQETNTDFSAGTDKTYFDTGWTPVTNSGAN